MAESVYSVSRTETSLNGRRTGNGVSGVIQQVWRTRELQFSCSGWGGWHQFTAFSVSGINCTLHEHPSEMNTRQGGRIPVTIGRSHISPCHNDDNSRGNSSHKFQLVKRHDDADKDTSAYMYLHMYTCEYGSVCCLISTVLYFNNKSFGQF